MSSRRQILLLYLICEQFHHHGARRFPDRKGHQRHADTDGEKAGRSANHKELPVLQV